jgi:ribosomal RNA assembly protein
MQEIYIEEIQKVIQNKNKLESELNVKIENKGKLVFVSGEAPDEYLAIKVLESINLGFSISRALLLKNEEILLRIIPLKNITRRKNLHDIKARIIGTNGKAVKTLNELTDCAISICDNKIGIIGNIEDIDEAYRAVTSLVQGSKHGNVYSKLEKEKKIKRIERKLNLKIKDNKI